MCGIVRLVALGDMYALAAFALAVCDLVVTVVFHRIAVDSRVLRNIVLSPHGRAAMRAKIIVLAHFMAVFTVCHFTPLEYVRKRLHEIMQPFFITLREAFLRLRS